MAEPRPRYAVILAGMRTGSNLLEESLGAFEGVVTHGELFNPHFFGAPGETARFGFSLAARAADPMRVVEAMTSEGAALPVFRLFEDHDPRVLDAVLADPRAAKIVLRRPALDAWVSLKIARRTGQWWLGDERRAETARVSFDPQDFERFSQARAAFHARIGRDLRRSGQTAFEIGYDDLFDQAVIDGLAAWLGLDATKRRGRVTARVQNPTPLAERLVDPEGVAATLARLSAPDLWAQRDYEPSRGPGLRGFVACGNLPILYMPIRGAAPDPVAEWLGGQTGAGEILSAMNRKDLRRWWDDHPGHRAFTILRHPLRRAWDAFARHIMPPDGFSDIRDLLVRRHGMVVPDDKWSLEGARAAFAVFLTFLRANLDGQTSVRVDASWTSQGRHLSAIAGFAAPDVVMREETLSAEIAHLAAMSGAALSGCPRFPPVGAFAIEDITTPEIEALSARAYRRDMQRFGFTTALPQAA